MCLVVDKYDSAGMFSLQRYGAVSIADVIKNRTRIALQSQSDAYCCLNCAVAELPARPMGSSGLVIAKQLLQARSFTGVVALHCL